MATARKVITPKSTKAEIDVLKEVLTLHKGAKVFSQGAKADAIFFVHTGKVKVTVTSAYGKEALLRVIGPHDFFGEECLVAGALRTSTATSSEPSTIFRIQKQGMLRALRTHTEFSNNFLTKLLARSVNLELDLCEQVFNHSEKRLARVLLRLARFANQHRLSDTKSARVTHAILAELVGISRSKVSLLMRKFRNMGWIDYKGRGDVTIKVELLSDVVLASK